MNLAVTALWIAEGEPAKPRQALPGNDGLHRFLHRRFGEAPREIYSILEIWRLYSALHQLGCATYVIQF